MNSFGRKFRVTIFGESHGQNIGVVIDGCPAGICVCADDFSTMLSRRKAGLIGTTSRSETDTPRIVSGVFNNRATGAPIAIFFDNDDVNSTDYDGIKVHPRPSHADFVAAVRYLDYNDYRGGGHFSGRLTAGIVAAGVVAKIVVPEMIIESELVEIGGETDKKRYDQVLKEAIEDGDSVGGVVECRIKGIGIGLGEPFWDSVESLISHAVFAIPGVKGIEFGVGFAAARMRASEHNDPIVTTGGEMLTNNAGGVYGGLTSGAEIVFRVAFKPTASIAKEQRSVNMQTGEVEPFSIRGRHDCCIAIRGAVVVECMAAIVLADLKLLSE